MQEYLFSWLHILEALAEMIGNTGNSPALVGVIMKHRDSKTFKYIVRNVIALPNLRLTDDFSL